MILPTAYLPSYSYYQNLLQEETQIEVWESFEKQTFRNRCRIIDPQGQPILLSIPVKKVEHKQFTCDIQIAYQARWQHQHWMAIRSAYEQTPYFLYYADLIRPCYEKQYTYLVDFNEALTRIVAALLQQDIEASGYIHHPLPLTRTSEWSGQEWTDQHPWQNEISILDRLFTSGH